MEGYEQDSSQKVFVRPPSPLRKWILLAFVIILIITLALIIIGYLRFYIGRTVDPANEKITVSCPTPKEFCNQATDLKLSLPNNKEKKEGIGWKLPENASIKAVFDGTFKQQKIHGATPAAILITLVSPLGRFEATYIFLTSNPKIKFPDEITVEKGDNLANIEGIPLRQPGFNGANLQFYILDKSVGGKMVLLSPEDMLQEIELPKE